MRLEDDGTLKMTEQEIRDRAAGKKRPLNQHLTEACQDWVARQWTPPRRGDWFITSDRRLYQLCYVDGWVLVSADGHWWSDQVQDGVSNASQPISKELWDQVSEGINLTPVNVKIEVVE